MKKLHLFYILSLFSVVLYSQTPQKFNYQAVVRNSSGDVIPNQNVSLKTSILKGNASGITVYSEEHFVTTNQFGLINLEIGAGLVLSGNFSSIEWGGDSYFLQIELDETGGTNYQVMGTAQLLSVPYSLYSGSSADSSLWERNANNIYYNAGNVGVGTITPNGRLQVNSDTTAGINDVIFSVLNANGDTVFAVYQEGVRIWVDDTGGSKANGNRGGFAVGGFSPTKAGFTNEYLRVTPDSVRIYIDDSYVPAKANGSRGGFAVGGFSPSKGTITDNYLFVQDDSTRMYVKGDEGFAVDNIALGSEGRYMDLTPQNYFIGHNSGQFNTTGLYNSFIGYQAGYGNTTGYNNLFMGYSSGYNNTTGYYNVFLGNSSGFNNISGFSNVFIGNNSGFNNDGGDYNVFLGNYSGQNNTTGTRNVMLGLNCGGMNTTGSYNTFLGTFAGYGTTTQSSNVILGNEAGRNNAGSNNIVMGYMAGYNNTGTNNVLLGYMSGYLNQSDNNTFVGTSSGYNNTTGLKNVFLGYHSGYLNTTGSKNIYIGNNAGYSNSTSDQVICIGDSAGANNTAGNNIFIGSQSGRSNTTGGNNIFLGTMAGSNNTTGSSNTYVGWGAGNNNNGTNNVMIGYWAGLFATASSNNLFLGQGAGLNNTGNDNIFLGYATSNPSGNNCIFIGNQLTPTGSNKLYIESMGDQAQPLIYGDFSTDLLGINDNAPTANLHIKQVGAGEEGLAIENDGDTDVWSWEIGANDLFLSFNGVNVGQWDDATGNYTAISDKRLKKDIEQLNQPVLSKVLQLKPVSYRLKHAGEDTRKTIGFIAQDVNTVFPELVIDREDGYLGLNYDDFAIISIKAIQEQQNIIQQQQQLIKLLEKRIEKLEKIMIK